MVPCQCVNLPVHLPCLPPTFQIFKSHNLFHHHLSSNCHLLSPRQPTHSFKRISSLGKKLLGAGIVVRPANVEPQTVGRKRAHFFTRLHQFEHQVPEVQILPTRHKT